MGRTGDTPGPIFFASPKFVVDGAIRMESPDACTPHRRTIWTRDASARSVFGGRGSGPGAIALSLLTSPSTSDGRDRSFEVKKKPRGGGLRRV